MEKEIRQVCYDNDLHLEAYIFKGIQKSFPNHFHDYYVIGFIESGERSLSCKNVEYKVGKGDILLFNPNDNHSCIQCDGGTLDYRGLNISKKIMMSLVEEITGERNILNFTENVIKDDELNYYLHFLHQMIMNSYKEFEKEETILLIVELLIQSYGTPFLNCISECNKEIERTCDFIIEHFSEHITLEDLCRCSNLSKSTLLRAFTKLMSITPYKYLQVVRISKAKEMLEQGMTTIDVAMQTGFSDQSHFSKFFNLFIGVSPNVYRRIFKECKNNE